MNTGTIQARIDAETRRAIEAFRESSGLDSSSQAYRVLIGMGLQAAQTGELSKEQYRALIYREAYAEVIRQVRAALGSLVREWE